MFTKELVGRMMAFLSLALVSLLWVEGYLTSPRITHRILVLQKQGGTHGNGSVVDCLFADGNLEAHRSASELMFDFTVLEDLGGSAIHQETLAAFCEQIASRGVSVVISCDSSAHPNLLDIYASYMGIPVMKIFSSDTELHPVKQEWSTMLHLEPDPISRLDVIYQLLKNYKWDCRMAVISHENNTNMASRLYSTLRKDWNSFTSFEILFNFTITYEERSILRALNILLTLQVKVVVILLKDDLATKLMATAQLYGFANQDCVWILAHSQVDFSHRDIPLPGKILRIRLAQQQNVSLTTKEALAKDSLKILRQAFQNISMEGMKISEPPKNCSSTSHWYSGKLLYKALKLVQANGYSGRIQFDQNGFRTNIDYDVDYWPAYENQSGNNEIVIARYQNNVLKVLRNGWPPVTGEDILESRLAAGLALRVAVVVQEPYIAFNKHARNKSGELSCALGLPCFGVDGQQSCCSGYCIDLIKLLKKDIGFSVRIHLVKDGKYGALDHRTGQWSGLIGEVVRGDTDIALADLTINEQRSTVVDFTHPFIGAGMGVLVKVFRRDKSNWTGFLDPFAITLWVTIVIIVNVVLLCMWLMERFSPYGRRERKRKGKPNRHTFNFIEATWFTWSLVFQTFDVGMRPKSFACRILALSFAFCMLIVITSYTANLAAFLVVEEEILPLSDAGIRDLKLQNPPANFKIATVKDSSFERFFQATEDPMLNRIWHYMKHDSVETFSEGIRQMNLGKLQAFVGDYPTFENFAAKSKDCSFKVVGKPFFQSGFGLAIKKNSSLTAKISQTLVQYESYDITRKLKDRWFVGQCSAENEEDGARFARLSMNDLIGLFLAICLGVIISVIFLIVGYCKDGFKKSSTYIFGQNIFSR